MERGVLHDEQGPVLTDEGRRRATHFVGRAIERVRASPVDRALLPSPELDASLFAGAAGVAFFLQDVAELEADADLLELASSWAATGRGAPGDLRCGLLDGEAGSIWIEALVRARRGRAVLDETASARWRRIGQRCLSGDLFSGIAGLLVGVHALASQRDDDNHRALAIDLESNLVAALGSLRLAQIAEEDDLGLAHGVAGTLWALVSCGHAGSAFVDEALGSLASLRLVDEEGLTYWPRCSGGPLVLEGLGSLCGGMAGHTLLWTEAAAARTARTSEWMALARASAETTAALAVSDPSLCCGLAGQAVALARFAEVSGDEAFAQLAEARLLASIASAESLDASLRLALWPGTLGVALTAANALRGRTSSPFFALRPSRGLP